MDQNDAAAVDKELQAVVDNMRAADVDKPTDYEINWGNKRSGTADTTKTPLYTRVNEDLFQRPVYKALIKMYDAKVFSPDVCVKEPDMNGFRKQYILNVFDTFTNTTVFQLAFKYLQSIGKAGDWASFRPKLWTLWMGTYSRCSGTLGSSGFEHVFSGEWKGSKVDGHHSWVNYYRQEKAGDINYHGYVSYDDKLTGTFQYTWGKYLKKTGGFNTGTSPGMPFDFSLFSICALTKTGGKCRYNLDGFPMGVTAYVQSCNEGTCLSTAYPTNN
ncbi:unnamed protein product [Enterobius vermicularis]|uniref:Endoribonuclease n=1 Tax=Enterobius vermicularis TaxID=51028 RepID=A0A0N4VGS0_ENTVE|nr:unnamed protein product [Enterobius vermicularis]